MRPCPRGALLVAATLACVALPARADLWGVKTKDPLSSPPSTLFRIEAGSFFPVGEIRLGGVLIEVDGIAVLPGPTLRAFRITDGPVASQLVAVDAMTAVATAIGPALDGRKIRGAGYGGGGKLLAVDDVANQLLEIDEATGVVIGAPVAITYLAAPFNLLDGCDLVESAGGQWVLSNSNSLYALDPLTGALTLLHVDGAAGPDGSPLYLVGLAWGADLGGGVRFAGMDINGNDEIFAYDPAAGYARTLAFGNILPAYNAGRGDLASPAVTLTAVPDAAPARPSIAAWPNPARGAGSLAFVLPRAGAVEIDLHDAAGRRVRKIAAGFFSAGRHFARWDGRGEDGRALPPGLYFYRLRSDAGPASARVALVP